MIDENAISVDNLPEKNLIFFNVFLETVRCYQRIYQLQLRRMLVFLSQPKLFDRLFDIVRTMLFP